MLRSRFFFGKTRSKVRYGDEDRMLPIPLQRAQKEQTTRRDFSFRSLLSCLSPSERGVDEASTRASGF